jgi:hypothetical protein
MRPAACDPVAKLKEFRSKNVVNFDRSVSAMAKPGQIVIAPKEFSEVVACGKATVPGLIDLLDDRDAHLADASRLALEEITNKQFNSPRIGSVQPAPQSPNVLADRYKEWWTVNKARTEIEWLTADILTRNSRSTIAVRRLGYLGDRSAIPVLRGLLEDRSLSGEAAIALARLKDIHAVPVLIDQFLKSDSQPLRKEGVCQLYLLTGSTLGYDPGDTGEARQRTVLQWRAWYKEREASER